jgi:hypothetical protein
MKFIRYILLFLVIILLNRCITEFTPQTNEEQQLVVVEGLITDLPEAYVIKLSKSIPLGAKAAATPLSKCNVTISDDLGNVYYARESDPGTYLTDPSVCRGVTGRKYSLNVALHRPNGAIFHYQSFPVEMKPVPPIDSLYFEKVLIRQNVGFYQPDEGAKVYLDTHSPDNSCKFYRWEFDETWEFHLPYEVPNKKCWLSSKSDQINVKSTAAIAESRVTRYPLNYISNETDRLKVKYSMLVKQYSLNEDEFVYWDKLRNITEQVGGLYDITPSSIPSNIMCIEDPGEKVLGYFSVSACSTKRVFVKDLFSGIIDLYTKCVDDTIWKPGPIPNLDVSVWLIINHDVPPPPYRAITYSKGCYDCTLRGTNVEPSYWRDDEKKLSGYYTK